MSSLNLVCRGKKGKAGVVHNAAEAEHPQLQQSEGCRRACVFSAGCSGVGSTRPVWRQEGTRVKLERSLAARDLSSRCDVLQVSFSPSKSGTIVSETSMTETEQERWGGKGCSLLPGLEEKKGRNPPAF